MRKPCEKHPGAKLAKDGRCSKCESIRRMEYRARNLEKQLAYRASYAERERELARARHAANPEVRRTDTRRYRDAHPERVRGNNKTQYWKNPEVHRERQKAWRIANPDKVLAKAREWKLKNPEKTKAFMTASVKKWRKKYPGRAAAYVRDYQTRKRHAMPSWGNRFFIREIYELAALRTKLTGLSWHVDHIVPIKSQHVCGLHVEDNLQVIPWPDNRRKSNRHWPDMPREALSRDS